MDFLDDYWTYHKCYEIPRNYALWSGIGLLSSIVHKHVQFLHGDIPITGPMYIGLIGAQGISKSTCCSFAKHLYQLACPDGHIGPSRTSPEKIVNLMSADNFPRVFQNWKGESVEVRQYAFFINEFKNFVGRGPIDMINLLTDIYDVPVYDGSSIARDVELVVNPAVTILMCETPDWFMRNVKGELITGGIGRRFVLVYEIDEPDPIPFIHITAEASEAKKRLQQRLLDVKTVTGEFQWSPTAKPLFDKWYRDTHARRVKESNQMMRGYLKSKHIQLFKVMMLLDCVSDFPTLTFYPDLLDHCIALLDVIEKNMPRLSMASGRNELMMTQLKILELVEEGHDKEPGWVPKNFVRRAVEAEVTSPEFWSILKHLTETEQLVDKTFKFDNLNGKEVPMLIAPWKLKDLKAKGILKEKSENIKNNLCDPTSSTEPSSDQTTSQ